jgi:hypothetical protein
MPKSKLVILKNVTPPGFNYRELGHDRGFPEVMDKLDPCKVGDVIEIDESDLVSRYGFSMNGIVQRYIDRGVCAIADKSERVTKTAEHGAFRNAKSGNEKPEAVLTEANASDKH